MGEEAEGEEAPGEPGPPRQHPGAPGPRRRSPAARQPRSRWPQENCGQPGMSNRIPAGDSKGRRSAAQSRLSDPARLGAPIIRAQSFPRGRIGPAGRRADSMDYRGLRPWHGRMVRTQSLATRDRGAGRCNGSRCRYLEFSVKRIDLAPDNSHSVGVGQKLRVALTIVGGPPRPPRPPAPGHRGGRGI